MVKIQPKTLFVGKNLIFLPSCHSTNDIASEIIQKNQFIDGTVILTDHQTQGKGQRGNVWKSSPKENLLMSIMFKTNFMRATDQFDLSIMTALSIFEALKSLSFENLKIKWPNDILLNERKIGGILIENTLKGQNLNYSVVGIGLNILQLDFENKRASSLKKEYPELELNREEITEQICESLEKNFILLKSGQQQYLKSKYLQNLFRLEEYADFRTDEKIITGKILGVAADGKLKILSENQEKYYNIKEIQYIFND